MFLSTAAESRTVFAGGGGGLEYVKQQKATDERSNYKSLYVNRFED